MLDRVFRGPACAALIVLCLGIVETGTWAQQDVPPAVTAPVTGTAPSLTIYNQNFAVVRESVHLDLGSGPTAVTYAGATGLLEPDSVILRDPTGKRALQVREQSFLGDTATVGRLLKKFEGKTLDFLVTSPQTGESRVVTARLIRAAGGQNFGGLGGFGGGSGYSYGGPQYDQGITSYVGADIVEVDGKVRFGLPGIPLFPREATEGETLRPALSWTLLSDKPGPLDAELAYLSGGFGWHADYNVVAPEKGDMVDLIGWVTMTNASGRTFENARIKLLAGDVVKLQPRAQYGGGFGGGAAFGTVARAVPPAVTEKSFDEYHLYTLQFPTTLRDREMKQVEFARATQVKALRLYVYDGAQYDPNRGNDSQNERTYGTEQTNTTVWVMREFDNTKPNGLGIPLPAGRVRFYRRDGTGAEGTLEFVGENTIRHTPQGEKVRLYTGDSFDLVGERRQTDFKYDEARREYTVEESFEVKVRNRKAEPAEIRVVEHLYRYANWYLFAHSDAYTKLDSATIEFRIPLKPDEERTVTYTVRYTSWPVDEKGVRVSPPPPTKG